MDFGAIGTRCLGAIDILFMAFFSNPKEIGFMTRIAKKS